MESLSSADRFIAQLRQKLAERAEAQSKASGLVGKRNPAHDERPSVFAVATKAAQAGAEDQRLRRIIVEQLLTERLGRELTNEPRFQAIVSQVADIMSEDPELLAQFEVVESGIKSWKAK